MQQLRHEAFQTAVLQLWATSPTITCFSHIPFACTNPFPSSAGIQQHMGVLNDSSKLQPDAGNPSLRISSITAMEEHPWKIISARIELSIAFQHPAAACVTAVFPFSSRVDSRSSLSAGFLKSVQTTASTHLIKLGQFQFLLWEDKAIYRLTNKNSQWARTWKRNKSTKLFSSVHVPLC